jgi:radical SAM enzyme (TIGR01210 family)
LPLANTNRFPLTAADRDRWILARRPARNFVDPGRPAAFLIEDERSESGEVVPVATVFLTNRECPWRCVMCDLWKNTTTEPVPPGAIPAQIDQALLGLAGALRQPRQIKLYNSGSFFDPRAVPVEDHAAIATRLRSFERVIVECHPALVGETALGFQERLEGQLEMAMGLETADPEVLPRLNKRMTLDQFREAADFLRAAGIPLRVFILVKPPFQAATEAVHWAKESLEFAFSCGATVAVLIPTRTGNGAMEALAADGDFSPPTLEMLEAAADYGIGRTRCRVFADLWDVEKFQTCADCGQARRARLQRMNLSQQHQPPVSCARCGSGTTRPEWAE